MADAFLTVAQAAAQLGAGKSTVNEAIRRGLFPDAVRDEAQYQGGAGRWLIPADAVAALKRDEFGRILWGGRSVTSGRRPSVKRVRPPKCKRCGILLAQSGDLLHGPDRADAGVCWMCREEGR